MRRAAVIVLDSDERKFLEKWAKGRRTPARLVLRAKIILLAAEGTENQQIAERLGSSRQTVGLWRRRYFETRRAGIEKDAPRGGRPSDTRQAAEKRIIETTTREKPRKATQWSTRTLAKKLGVSRTMVLRVWKANGLKPHLHRTFKLSNGPDFESKLIDLATGTARRPSTRSPASSTPWRLTAQTTTGTPRKVFFSFSSSGVFGQSLRKRPTSSIRRCAAHRRC